jgi:hypothetical protein
METGFFVSQNTLLANRTGVGALLGFVHGILTPSCGSCTSLPVVFSGWWDLLCAQQVTRAVAPGPLSQSALS